MACVLQHNMATQFLARSAASAAERTTDFKSACNAHADRYTIISDSVNVRGVGLAVGSSEVVTGKNQSADQIMAKPPKSEAHDENLIKSCFSPVEFAYIQ